MTSPICIKITSTYLLFYVGLQRTEVENNLNLPKVCTVIKQKTNGRNRPTERIHQIESSSLVNRQRLKIEVQEKY